MIILVGGLLPHAMEHYDTSFVPFYMLPTSLKMNYLMRSKKERM
jgi:hypothetical protein